MKSVLSSSNLETTAADTVKGFVWQAKEKLPKADSFIQTANYFEQNLAKIQKWDDVFNDPKLKDFAIAASCLSKKSLNHIDAKEQRSTIESLIEIQKLKDPTYFSTIRARYFLTCGDSLGGSMRNAIGQNAQQKLTDLIITALQKQKQTVNINTNGNQKIVGVNWKDRFLYFDKKPAFIDKSVDLILVKGSNDIEKPSNYLACGELKGGIDPAGADEHWKTASAALRRINDIFVGKNVASPKFFFVGAAIEKSMAAEIFANLQANKLYAAANLNHVAQMEELVELLVNL